jgi:hypothetical protein
MEVSKLFKIDKIISIMKIKSVFVLCLFFIYIMIGVVTAQTFIHPGLLHSKEDLERMKKAVANKEEPIFSGYNIFIQNPASQSNYKMQGPMAMVGRNPTVGQATYDNDANAAHQNAIMWYITGDTAYAKKTIEIINAWSSTLKSITGRDAVLMAGLGPFKMVNAAEIMRYTYKGWSEKDIKQTEQHFKDVIYPIIKDFAPFANGNWDAAAIQTVMAIGVFCNDRTIFERALRYYVNGQGDGRLTNYVINEAGQIQESGRDQQHTQLGIGLLSESCEIAWHQGLNLYGYADNRLLKGFEYVAKFNLGNEVPFTETLDRTGKYHHTIISQQGRCSLRAVYEQIYYHYVNRMGMSAPFTQQAAEKLRPEGPGKPGADHPGYGTLYYSKPVQSKNKLFNQIPVPPAGIIVSASSKEINLTWVEPIGATGYTVKRAFKHGGPYVEVAKNVIKNIYTDKQITPGVLYYYTVSATNTKGESRNANETAITAGLPSPWDHHDIGNMKVEGTTDFNGTSFFLQASGMGLDSTKDEFQYVYRQLKGDGEITARFIPQPGSQFSRMGLMIRETISESSPCISLYIFPGKTGQIEAPAWQVKLLTRKNINEKISLSPIDFSLNDPAISWGRLTGFVWLRLQRKGNTFTGFTSYDGLKWTTIGTVSCPLNKIPLIGISVASGIKTISSIFQLDNVSITNAL